MITVDDRFKTPNGKEIGIRRVTDTWLYEPYFISGGEKPKALQGKFTKPKYVAAKIDEYIAANKFRKPKAVKEETQCQDM